MRARHPARLMFAAATAALLLVTVAGPSAWAAPGDGPPLVTGSKEGPVAIGGGRGVPDTLIGKVDVGPGAWVAWAKLQVQTDSSTVHTVVSCRLVSGTRSSKVSATLGWSNTWDFINHAMELSQANVTRSGGQFRLYCRTQNGHAGTEARYIRLDAVKVDQLVRADLDDGTTTTVGSGDVMAIAGEADDPVSVGGANQRKTTVADLTLPTGNWWVRAEMALHGQYLHVACTLSLGDSADTAKVSLGGALSAVMDLTAHVARGDPHSLKIKCGSDAGQGVDHAVVDQVRLTVFGVARLVEHNLGAGTNHSFGVGAPEVRSSFANTAYVEISKTNWSTVASLGLNAEDWLAFGRVGRPIGNSTDQGTVYPDDIECELYLAPTVRDRAAADTAGQQVPGVPLLAYVPIFGRGTVTLVLRCRTPANDSGEPPYSGLVTWIRLTALRVGAVTTQDI